MTYHHNLGLAPLNLGVKLSPTSATASNTLAAPSSTVSLKPAAYTVATSAKSSFKPLSTGSMIAAGTLRASTSAIPAGTDPKVKWLVETAMKFSPDAPGKFISQALAAAYARGRSGAWIGPFSQDVRDDLNKRNKLDARLRGFYAGEAIGFSRNPSLSDTLRRLNVVALDKPAFYFAWLSATDVAKTEATKAARAAILKKRADGAAAYAKLMAQRAELDRKKKEAAAAAAAAEKKAAEAASAKTAAEAAAKSAEAKRLAEEAAKKAAEVQQVDAKTQQAEKVASDASADVKQAEQKANAVDVESKKVADPQADLDAFNSGGESVDQVVDVAAEVVAISEAPPAAPPGTAEAPPAAVVAPASAPAASGGITTTHIAIGVGVLAAGTAGYFFWKKQQAKKIAANRRRRAKRRSSR